MAGEGEKKLTELPSEASLPGNSCTSVERLRRRIQMRRPPTGGARKANLFIFLFFIYFFILLLSEKKGTSPTHPPPTAAQCLEWRQAAEMLTGEGGSLSEALLMSRKRKHCQDNVECRWIHIPPDKGGSQNIHLLI